MSVKFTDDNGISEGAVDLGGPMREFFTLILDHLHSSQLFVDLKTIGSCLISLNAYRMMNTSLQERSWQCPLYMEGPLHSFFRP